MGWRDTRKAARAVVHATMKVSAILLSELGEDSNTNNILGQLTVRVHEKQTKIGDQAGTSLSTAERAEAVPTIVFWRDELTAIAVTLTRNMVVSVAEGEAYNIDRVWPHDQETIKCDVTRLDAADSAGLPLPE